MTPTPSHASGGDSDDVAAASAVDSPGGVPPADGAVPVKLAPRQYLWALGAILIVLAALHWLGAVLTPFLVGVILAYLGAPVVERCERLGIGRNFGTLAAVLFMGVLVLAVLLVVLPLLQAEIALMLRQVPALADLYGARIAPWIEQNLGIRLALEFATIRTLIADNAARAGEVGLTVLSGVRSGGAMIIGVLLNLALIPVVMFYFLRDGPAMLRRIDHLVPRRWRATVRGMARDIDHVLSEFLHGQMLVMGSLAAYYALGLSLAGLQFGLPIGLLTGILVFVPYVGFGTGLLLGVLAALLQWNGLTGFLSVLAVYGVGQLLENYVLVPFLVGDRIGLHPLAVIFALLAFGELFGFAGVLLALPASAVLLVALRRLVAAYKESPMYRAR